MKKNMLTRIQLTFTGPILDGVFSHHEAFSGHGYPNRLRGDEIPLAGRLIAVADAFDAMTSDGPYNEGMPPERALEKMLQMSGSQWDPEIVEALVAAVPNDADVAEALSWGKTTPQHLSSSVSADSPRSLW